MLDAEVSPNGKKLALVSNLGSSFYRLWLADDPEDFALSSAKPTAVRACKVTWRGDSKDLLVSGLLEGAGEIAEHAAVVDVPVEKGHVVLFSNNPIWRGETLGSYFLVFNAMLNFDQLDTGRPPAAE